MSTQIQSPPALKLTEQADLARSQGKLSSALVWINTAAILEKSDEANDLASPVNARLLGIIFDAATYSEDLALKCGNFTRNHIEWLKALHEANALLLSRIRGQSNNTSNTTDDKNKDSLAVLALISGHLETLQERFVTHSYENLRLPTPTAHISDFVAVMQHIREQTATLAPVGTCPARSLATKLLTLNYLVGNANAQILSFPLRCLSDWELASFCINQALLYAAQLPLKAAEIAGSEEQVIDLRSTLAAVKQNLTAKNYQGTRIGLASARKLVNEVGGFSRSL